jgi:hypothetical protein
MFKLIVSKSYALEEAHAFASDNIPHAEPGSAALSKTIPARIKFPCLIDWFVNFDYRNQEMLDYNICHRSDAKCLVYPRTNKPDRLYQLILTSDIDLGAEIGRSRSMPTTWKRSKIILDDNFDEVMDGRRSPDEPFFVKVRMVSHYGNDQGHLSHLRVSAVNLTMAKELVYYAKNNKPTFAKFSGSWANAVEIGTITVPTVHNMSDESLLENVHIDESRISELLGPIGYNE